MESYSVTMWMEKKFIGSSHNEKRIYSETGSQEREMTAGQTGALQQLCGFKLHYSYTQGWKRSQVRKEPMREA